MPRVIINEIDRTQYNVTTNESDNIVYVVGSAIKGPTDKPYLCKSVTEFTSLFGDYGTNPDELTISSWEYATNLLISGFPVLFRRIIGTYDSATDTYDLSAKASHVFDDGANPAVTQFTATAKKPGSYGNNYEITITIGYTIDSAAVDKAGTFKIAIANTRISNSTREYETAEFAIGTLESDVNAAVKALILSIEDADLVFDVETSFAVNTAWNGKNALTGGTDPTVSSLMNWLGKNGAANAIEIFDEIKDKDLYDVKFLTLGGMYAAIDISTVDERTVLTELVKIASDTRRDCLAILDIPYTLDKSSDGTDLISNPTTGETYFDFLAALDPTAGTSYACSYDPWFYFKLPMYTTTNNTITTGERLVSGSFVFLYELAKSLKNGNPIWLPPAGVNRGLVTEATGAYFEIGSVRAEAWAESPRFINPIRKIRNYGYAIFGQKTLYKVDSSTETRSAFQDLSVRITANEIKRKIRDISIGLTFENNNLKTWNAFRAELDPYLMTMAADGALDNYQILMDATTTTEADINNNTVRGTVIVQIARAAEDFNIDFIVTNSSAEFNEAFV